MQCSIQNHDNMLTARLSGQFLFGDHPIFRDLLTHAEESRVQKITIDLTALDFIDSAGLGMLLMLRDSCMKHQRDLVLFNPHGQVGKVFAISKFEHLFTIQS